MFNSCFIDYDVSRFDGKKYIYLSETSELGGTNKLMGILFLSVAAIIIIIMLVFGVTYWFKVKDDEEFYNPDLLEW